MITYDKNEKIIHIARCHKSAFVMEIIFLIIAGIFPYFAHQKGMTLWLIDLFARSGQDTFFLSLAFYTLWLLLLWILFFIAWSDYYLDVWIITDGRVIDVEQTGVFRRQINTFRLDKIIDMVVTDRSWIAKIFNYGNINVGVEGTIHKFTISEVPEPEKIRDLIKEQQKNTFERLEKTLQFEEGK